MESHSSSNVKIFKVREIVHKMARVLFPVFLVTHVLFFCPLLWYICITRILPQPEWYSSLGNLIFVFLGIGCIPFAVGIAYQTIWTWFGQYSFSVESDHLMVRKFIGRRQIKESTYCLDKVWNWSVRKDERMSTSLAQGRSSDRIVTLYTCQIVYEGKLVELLSNDSPEAPAELGGFLAEFMPDKEYHHPEDQAKHQVSNTDSLPA